MRNAIFIARIECPPDCDKRDVKGECSVLKKKKVLVLRSGNCVDYVKYEARPTSCGRMESG
jgi:hypothetical protein